MNVKRALAFLFVLAAATAVATLVFSVTRTFPPLRVLAAPRLLPGGSTVGGVLVSDDTWGPGTITVTSDIWINAGVTIVITPGTTVQIATTDGADLGVDANRIEYLVAGTLQVNGPVTFTSQSGTPVCGDWVGIYFLPGSDGYLDNCIVEYGVHAVQIDTSQSITIANSTLRENCHEPPVGNAWGAGMAIYGGTHLVTGTVIHDNDVEAGAGGLWGEGGGVQIMSGAGPTLFQNCKVHDNLARNQTWNWQGWDAGAGGINVLSADPILRNCEIYSNTSVADQRAFGGGVYLGDSNAVIEADTFIHNNQVSGGTLSYGGGICLSEAMMPVPPRPIIRDSRVVSNVVGILPSPPGYVGPRRAFGGGIAFYEGSRTRAVISNTLIGGNTIATLNGSLCGGGIGMANGASADRFDGNLIRDNSVVSGPNPGLLNLGGGICLTSTNGVTVTNNLVFNNKVGGIVVAPPYGGGIYANGPRSYLVNNTVVSNTVYIAAPTTLLGQGAGVYLADGVLSNTVVMSNFATGDGGGVYWAGGSVGYNDVWGNSCLFAGCAANYAASGNPRPATDVNADPRFVGNGDLETRYHLRQDSPCVDQGFGLGIGVPGDDYDGEPRPNQRGWDIGFDEVYAPVLTITKQASGSLIAGLPLTYTLLVTNTGTIAARNVLVTDALPVGASYVGGGIYANGLVSLTAGSIPTGGGSAQVSFAVSTCQTSLVNQQYRVADSLLGATSGWGAPLMTSLSPPTLKAGFDSAPTAITSGDTAYFTSTSTTDGSAIVAWSWDFGDGTLGNGTPMSHTYTTAGSYTVTLSITDACGFAEAVSVANALAVEEVLYLPIVLRSR